MDDKDNPFVKYDPFRIFDDYVHGLIVRGSHFIQRNFHLNRDHLVAICYLVLVPHMLFTTWLEITDLAESGDRHWVTAAVWHCSLKGLAIYYFTWLVRSHARQASQGR